MYKQTKLRGYQEGLSNLILAAGFYIQRPQKWNKYPEQQQQQNRPECDSH